MCKRAFSCWLCSWRLQRTGVQAQEETKLDVAGTFPTSMVILGDVSRTEVQGFLFSDARPAEELIKLVERLRNRDVAAA